MTVQLIRAGMPEDEIRACEMEALTAQIEVGTHWREALDPEIMNILSAYWFAQDKDTPGKTWWNATAQHPAIFRAMRIDPADPASVYAIAHLRITRIDGAPFILAAYPTPRILGPLDLDWLEIDQVLAWNPVTDQAHILSDPNPQLFGPLNDDQAAIHASPFAYLRSWCEARARFFVEWQGSHGQAWRGVPNEPDLAPGALMVGRANDIPWCPSAMPDALQVHGIDPTIINKAILRAARLPFARAGNAA